MEINAKIPKIQKSIKNAKKKIVKKDQKCCKIPKIQKNSVKKIKTSKMQKVP